MSLVVILHDLGILLMKIMGPSDYFREIPAKIF